MVGLVIVSHSAKLAEGVAELARGMAGPDVKIAATGGLALPDQPLGTDAVLIFQAIEQVYSERTKEAYTNPFARTHHHPITLQPK
jgi:dihydroxyacetone kinase DhaKLM complex PTS-EIIA-like component DhaM